MLKSETDYESAANARWWRVSETGLPQEGQRLHTRLEERYVTIFRHNSNLFCIDSICHHAGGPLTAGKLQDIEDLGITVVVCPWHKFLVGINGGIKAFQAVDIVNGVPTVAGWRTGKVVQRAHHVLESANGVFVVSSNGIN
jgi:nitrite reductase/ring-hydroxylating ferredoxin subunit